MKSLFIIPIFFNCMLYLTCIARVTICITMTMISIPAVKILGNEKSICNTRFFYLHAIFNLHVSFCMQTRSVYLWWDANPMLKCFRHLKGGCSGPALNEVYSVVGSVCLVTVPLSQLVLDEVLFSCRFCTSCDSST